MVAGVLNEIYPPHGQVDHITSGRKPNRGEAAFFANALLPWLVRAGTRSTLRHWRELLSGTPSLSVMRLAAVAKRGQ